MCPKYEKKGSHYSNDEKYHFIRLYHESGMSKRSFCKLHGISSASQLRYWLKKFTVPSEDVSLSSEVVSTMSNRSKEDYKDENVQLKKRIKELEKALAFSKLETEARDLMITRAEEYFNIPIRKNLGPNSYGTGETGQRQSCSRLPSVWPLSSSLLPV